MGRYSPMRGRRLTPYEQAVERFVATRAGGWLFVHACNRVDQRLLPLTRGRLSLAVGAPVGLLETIGARTGRPRHTPLLYLADGERVVLVASNVGRPQDPAWLHNVKAHPDVRFLTRDGRRRTLRAHIARDAERAELWARLLDLYAGYAVYQRRAGARELAIVVLSRPAPPAAA
jgi:deazaflavin-dependent oxidoreductase (nitroreductase family)